MSQFDTLQSITSRLNELGDQLSIAKLTQEELEEFETLSRKLYEIIVILNYKAKEEVFKKRFAKSSEGIKAKEEPEIQKMVEKKEDVPQPPKSEAKEAPSPGLIEFDFSGEPQTPEKTEEPKIHKEEIAAENENPNTEIQETPYQKSTEQKTTPEKIIPQEEVASFYQHFTGTYEMALKDKLSNAKINSIKNAIGLNDKLQFIKELFEGDTDYFNQSIEVLDQMENNEVALKKLSEIAAQKKWDRDAELVDYFANIINRRYVE